MRAAVSVAGEPFGEQIVTITDDRHPGERVLEVRDLHKTVAVGFSRRKVDILNGVDLEVRDGDVFGLLGPNGAGKTTTLKVVLGPHAPDERLGDPRRDGLAELGYLPENPYFYDYLTGSEFLRFCARLFSLDAGSATSASPPSWPTWASSAPPGCSCASTPRACCSASASPRRSSTSLASCSSTSP